MAPVAFLSQEKRPLSGLARESRKVPPFSTKACPVAVAPRPQRQPLRSVHPPPQKNRSLG